MSAERVLVVIPTYNEVDNLELVIDRVRASVPTADVLVVDDGSPDGTGALADRVAAHDEHVHVLHRLAKSGLGAAYIAGFEWGLVRAYDVLVEMDADGSHLPEQLPRLLGALEPGVGLVIGSRWVPEGRVVNWPQRRMLLSRTGNTYARWMLGLHLRDATAGYRAFHSQTLRQIDLASMDSQGYCFQVELALRTAEAGLLIVEVPITFVERIHGDSKMDGDIVREALVRVTQWGLQRRARWLRSLLARQTAKVG
ncbi:MAG: polyprenol monophosphomannose synthase [Nocardioidaceae bacterium]